MTPGWRRCSLLLATAGADLAALAGIAAIASIAAIALAGAPVAEAGKPGAQQPASVVEPAQLTAPAVRPAPSGAPDGDRKRAGSEHAPGDVSLDGIAVQGTQVVLSEGFEGAFPGSWSVFDDDGATSGEVYWDDTLHRSYTGSWSAYCADGGANASPPGTSYSNGMTSWMVYGPFSLADAVAGTLSFRYWNMSEVGFDYLHYVVSTNGFDFSGFRVSGNSSGWQSGSIDLADVPLLGDVTGQPAVWIAFVFTSDGSITFEGAYVDDVLVQKTVPTGGPDIRIDPATLSFTQPGTNRPIFVELDWMEDGTHSHRPSQAVVDRIAQSFTAAGFPVTIEVSNAIPHQQVIAITSSVAGSPGVQAIMAQNFNHAADSRYYYSVWGHNYSLGGIPTSSSGVADWPGRVHLVTLGSFSGQTGTFSNQVGTFVHEFGHNLGQGHGGADGDNYKPNYLSVMNYHYQLAGIGPSLLGLGFANTAMGFDDFSYSHGLMPSLAEPNLNELFGIGLGRAVDWNCDGVFSASIAKDIQEFNPCFANGGLSVLSDFDNWSSLSGQIRTLTAGVGPAQPRATITCITPEEQRPLQEKLDRLRELGLLAPDGPGVQAGAPQPGDAGHSFFIYNDGGAPLTVTSLALDVATPWIGWEPQAPFTLPPGGSQAVIVFVNFGQAPAGQTTRRILVSSNDPDESPYPGGVNLVVTRPPGQTTCYSLTRTHSGSGADPVASPGNSAGCAAGQYQAGQQIQLTASPTAGWSVAGWSGTLVNASNSTQNTATMPAAAHAVSVSYQLVVPNPALSFYTVTPCRAIDTRSSAPLASQIPRTFPVGGICGIPASAKAVSANVTVTQPSGQGHVSLWPGDLQQPMVSSINFAAGQTRANNVLLRLATSGSGSVAANAFVLGNGNVQLIVDVNGYFQ